MQKLFVFYDSNCEFCRRCRQWIERQPAYFPVCFIAADSEQARQLVPELENYNLTDELTALADDGALYQGANSFIICLYALVEFRELSLRLARPGLLPFARQAFHLISHHRDFVSSWLKQTDDKLAVNFAKYQTPRCGDGSLSYLLTARKKA